MRRRALLAFGVPTLLLLVATLFAAGKASDLNCDPPCENGVCTPYLGNLSCQCYGNWSGENCSTFACDVEEKCLNGGTCFPNPHDVSQYLCACQPPYFGSICQYIAKETHSQSSCGSEPDPCNGSTCYNLAKGGHQCICMEERWGVGCNYTDPDRNRCLTENVCNGHGQCVWDERFFTYPSGCNCDEGWVESFNCEIPHGTNFCPSNSPCVNGECSIVFRNNSGIVTAVDYQCTCDGTHQGKNCSEPFNVCDPNPCGEGTCNVTHGSHFYKCECPPGRMGFNCEFYEDPCSSLTCLNGGTCLSDVLPNSDGSYTSDGAKCVCCAGFDGSHCEMSSQNQTLCRPNPCRNGGQCKRLLEESYKCECGDDFTGINCELDDLCLSSPCHQDNTESCLTTTEGFVCVCYKGYGGSTCDQDIDECLDDPNACLNGGTCVNSPGESYCSCPLKYTGPRCEEYVNQPVNCSSRELCKNGGMCVDKDDGGMVCNCSKDFTGDLCEIPACQQDDCVDLATNGECDMKCFTAECRFDGGEGYCFPEISSDPWQNCTSASVCRQLSKNGVCDPQCNSRDCLFDSYECAPTVSECPADRVASCASQTDNNVCDEQCNTPQCPFDSEDCDSRDYLKDLLVVYILGPAGESFKDNPEAQRRFEEAIGEITKTYPVIKEVKLLSTEEGAKEGIFVPEGQNLYRVILRLDLEYCSDQCLQSVEEAVKFLNAHYASGQDIAGFSYVKSEAESEEDPTSAPSTPRTSVAIGVTIAAVTILGLFVVGGVLLGKRKRIKARIFYPGQSQVDDSAHDHSAPNKRRKSAQSSDVNSGTLVNSTEDSSMTASCSSGDYIREGSKNAKMGGGKITWADYKVPVGDSPNHDPSDMAVVSQVGEDSRRWNYLHYSAVRNPEVMRSLLEKCRSDDGKKWDVNIPGPGGYTPLMLAVTQKTVPTESFGVPSRSSSSSDTSTEVTEQNSLLLSPLAKNQLVPRSDTSSPSGSTPGSPFNCSVDALLSARVKLDATNDYGRTALHLAAVCARGDYVKKLLAAGANPNVQDNWGQSPLHASIGAAAEGAFHLLTNFSKTDINLKSDGGTTPLMDAVKSTNLYMVKQLVKKNADISLADYEGRTAVHWAAVVDNVEALKLLIRQGPDTIKDTQDNKGQTALFLACRESATECAKHLLDVFANATLLDNLDRSPMAIAFERQHHYIIEMLKSHGPYHYQLPANGRHAHGVPHHVQMVQQHHEMAMRQQVPPHTHASIPYPPPPTSHEMMMEMHAMPPPMPEQFDMVHGHHAGNPGPAPRGQTFGDVGYPVSSSMDLGLPGSASYKHNTPLFFSNTMQQTAEGAGVHTPTAAPQSFYPTSTSSQLPPSTEHTSPHTAYNQHPSPPTQLQPNTTSDLAAMTYTQPLAGVPSDPASTSTYPSYPTSSSHFAVTNTTSDSEQRLVSELITSISNDPPLQTSSTFTKASSATVATRPLQHIDMDANLPAYPTDIPTSDPYAPTGTQQQPQQLYSPPQQPHSAGSFHSNRSPSSLYPSPPNSDTLQHSEVTQQNGMATMTYSHASPPSLTPSPENRDDVTGHITTVEGMVQQHDYPSMLYGSGADSYHYGGGIRFVQDYNNETTV